MADHLEKVIKEIEAKLKLLPALFLERASKRAKRKISDLFKTEGRALNVEWSPLKEAYLRWKIKKGFSEKKLHRTTSLAQSFTSEVEGLQARVGTPVPYSIYHEYGTKKMPARPFMKPVAQYLAERGLKDVFTRVFKEVFG